MWYYDQQEQSETLASNQQTCAEVYTMTYHFHIRHDVSHSLHLLSFEIHLNKGILVFISSTAYQKRNDVENNSPKSINSNQLR